MKHNINISLLLVFSLFTGVTYAAGKSLWGDIDEPQTAPPVTQPQAGKTTAKDVVVAKPVVADIKAAPVQKSVCDVIRAQEALDPNLMRTPEMQAALRNNIQLVPAAYKGILSNTTSLNTMYTQYRAMYLKKYCN